MVKGRIAVIAEYFPPRLGSDRRIYEIMKRLSKKYDIHFLVVPPSYTLFIRKIDTYVKKKREVISEGMLGHELNLPKMISQFWTSSFLIAFMITEFYLCIQMLRKMATLRPNLIIINDTSVYTGLLGLICSKLLKKKLLVDYNDLMGAYTLDLIGKKTNRIFQNILGQGLVLTEDTLVRHGWKVTTITHFIKNYAERRRIRKDLIVVPNGVDTTLFDPVAVSGQGIRLKYGLSDGEKLCVYAGRIEEVSGAEILLETARLLENSPAIRFMLVGEGSSELLSELSNCDNVILTGRVPKETVPEYLAAADCIFVPFPNSVASHGISPLKLFEALAMSKPVIASSISGIKEAVCEDENVLLVSNDPKSWATAVTKLFENGEEYNRRGPTSREFILRNYDFNHLANIFETVVAEAF
jgi:glycosyltransferase involved in cell wall biosynthesis